MSRKKIVGYLRGIDFFNQKIMVSQNIKDKDIINIYVTLEELSSVVDILIEQLETNNNYLFVFNLDGNVLDSFYKYESDTLPLVNK